MVYCTLIHKFKILTTYLKYKIFVNYLGKGVIICKPLYITKRILTIGKGVYIWSNARIEGVHEYQGEFYKPKIIIDDFCTIQQNLHLTCANSIYIGKNTAIAANVTITDIHHSYDDISRPIEWQKLFVSSVFIDSNCKIYNNVVILPGTRIGNHCTIGANSVVSGIIPDFSVAVGAPARIVKRYNLESKVWQRTNIDGTYKNN
jgi:acetyltransferase-like isoleucine patch superfamily enzyme